MPQTAIVNLTGHEEDEHVFDRTQAVTYAVREGVIDVREMEYRPPGES